jgi:hypothetical protein
MPCHCWKKYTIQYDVPHENNTTDNSPDNEEMVDVVDMFVVAKEQMEQQMQRQMMDYYEHCCSICFCRERARSQPLLMCATPDCDNFLHMCCFTSKVKAKTSFGNLEDNKVDCKKSCYMKITSSMKGLSWHNNDTNGKNDPIILLTF